eukprot:COSAG06_NODE_111_length_23480_cov_56.592703_2_plen_1486_part_00
MVTPDGRSTETARLIGLRNRVVKVDQKQVSSGSSPRPDGSSPLADELDRSIRAAVGAVTIQRQSKAKQKPDPKNTIRKFTRMGQPGVSFDSILQHACEDKLTEGPLMNTQLELRKNGDLFGPSEPDRMASSEELSESPEQLSVRHIIHTGNAGVTDEPASTESPPTCTFEVQEEVVVTEGALPAAEESRPRRSLRIRFPPHRLELSCTNMEQEELSEEEYEAAVNGTVSDLSISVLADASPDVTYRDDGSADYSSDDGETTANGYSYETVRDGQTPSLAEIVGHIRLTLSDSVKGSDLSETFDEVADDDSVSHVSGTEDADSGSGGSASEYEEAVGSFIGSEVQITPLVAGTEHNEKLSGLYAEALRRKAIEGGMRGIESSLGSLSELAEAFACSEEELASELDCLDLLRGGKASQRDLFLNAKGQYEGASVRLDGKRKVRFEAGHLLQDENGDDFLQHWMRQRLKMELWDGLAQPEWGLFERLTEADQAELEQVYAMQLHSHLSLGAGSYHDALQSAKSQSSRERSVSEVDSECAEVLVVDSDPEGTAALEGGGETAVSMSSADPKGAEPPAEQVKVDDEPPKTAHAEVDGLEAVSLGPVSPEKIESVEPEDFRLLGESVSSERVAKQPEPEPAAVAPSGTIERSMSRTIREVTDTSDLGATFDHLIRVDQPQQGVRLSFGVAEGGTENVDPATPMLGSRGESDSSSVSSRPSKATDQVEWLGFQPSKHVFVPSKTDMGAFKGTLDLIVKGGRLIPDREYRRIPPYLQKAVEHQMKAMIKLGWIQRTETDEVATDATTSKAESAPALGPDSDGPGPRGDPEKGNLLGGEQLPRPPSLYESGTAPGRNLTGSYCPDNLAGSHADRNEGISGRTPPVGQGTGPDLEQRVAEKAWQQPWARAQYAHMAIANRYVKAQMDMEIEVPVVAHFGNSLSNVMCKAFQTTGCWEKTLSAVFKGHIELISSISSEEWRRFPDGTGATLYQRTVLMQTRLLSGIQAALKDMELLPWELTCEKVANLVEMPGDDGCPINLDSSSDLIAKVIFTPQGVAECRLTPTMSRTPAPAPEPEPEPAADTAAEASPVDTTAGAAATDGADGPVCASDVLRGARTGNGRSPSGSSTAEMPSPTESPIAGNMDGDISEETVEFAAGGSFVRIHLVTSGSHLTGTSRSLSLVIERDAAHGKRVLAAKAAFKQIVAASGSEHDMLAGSESVSSQAPIWTVMLSRRLGEQKATSHTRMQHLGFDLADENSSDEQIYEATVEFLATMGIVATVPMDIVTGGDEFDQAHGVLHRLFSSGGSNVEEGFIDIALSMSHTHLKEVSTNFPYYDESATEWMFTLCPWVVMDPQTAAIQRITHGEHMWSKYNGLFFIGELLYDLQRLRYGARKFTLREMGGSKPSTLPMDTSGTQAINMSNHFLGMKTEEFMKYAEKTIKLAGTEGIFTGSPSENRIVWEKVLRRIICGPVPSGLMEIHFIESLLLEGVVNTR